MNSQKPSQESRLALQQRLTRKSLNSVSLVAGGTNNEITSGMSNCGLILDMAQQDEEDALRTGLRRCPVACILQRHEVWL